MTNELVIYEGEQDVKSLNSLTSESKNIKRITFDFSSHKLLTQNNISHSILENYISNNLSNKRVILLGDFNDLLIDTYNVFDPFLGNPANYEFGDYYIAEDPSAIWSFPSWPSHIDHILITDELFGLYSVQTIAIDQLFFNNFTDYDNLISDHI